MFGEVELLDRVEFFFSFFFFLKGVRDFVREGCVSFVLEN